MKRLESYCRHWRTASVLLTLAFLGCRSAERTAIQPLSDDGPPHSYQDLAVRFKDQVLASQEFFYRDSWDELKQAAHAMQDTAARIKRLKPEQQPDRMRARLAKDMEEVTAAATDLHAAGAAKDVQKTNEIFQRLSLKVRDLRPE